MYLDEICANFVVVSILWNDAPVLASVVNLRTYVIKLYKRFASATFFTHQAIAVNITYEVHLMWEHVKTAMAVLTQCTRQKED